MNAPVLVALALIVLAQMALVLIALVLVALVLILLLLLAPVPPNTVADPTDAASTGTAKKCP